MENHQSSKPFRYYLVQCLSAKRRMSLVRLMVARKCGSYILNLPDDFTAAKNMLFVLPEDPLQALYQVTNVISIINLFNKTHKVNAVIVCEHAVAPYFKNLHGITTIYEYEIEQRYLFSRQLAEIEKLLLKEYIDICFFLERSPDISLLYLIGRLQTKVRVAYANVGSFPFFNLHIQPSARPAHRSEQNMNMAAIFNADIHTELHWSVAKETLAEITAMLKDASIPETQQLAGIDAHYFYHTFGKKWAESLVQKLSSTHKTMWYLYVPSVNERSFHTWLKSLNLPVFSDLTPSRTAALLHKSDLIISGKTIFFELAFLLRKQAIGVFEENEMSLYCRMTDQSVGVAYTKSVDEQTIDLVKTTADSLLSSLHN